MSTRGLTTIGLFAASVLGVGYGVAQYASSKSIGLAIPENKAILRTQGAQGEAVKAGMDKDEAIKKIGSVETHGGDKGLRVLERDG